MTDDFLLQIYRGTLNWIGSNLAYFKVTSSDDDLTVVREVKPIAELGLACDLLLRVERVINFGSRRTTNFVTDVLKQCWKELEYGEKIRCLLLKYPDLFSLVTVYPPFWRAGFKNEALDSAIRSLSSDSSIRALEFPAWRLIDFAVALNALNVPSPWKLKHEYKRTWLGQLPAPWMLSDSAAYSLTHTVFYTTDFGFKPNGLSPQPRRYITRWIRTWSTHYARIENFDLLGEMLMVGYCIGMKGLTEPLRYLARSQHANGAVPGPETIAASLGFSHHSRIAHEKFLLNYHTTIVALMTSILGLKQRSGKS
jgi:hypothetical protein